MLRLSRVHPVCLCCAVLCCAVYVYNVVGRVWSAGHDVVTRWDVVMHVIDNTLVRLGLLVHMGEDGEVW